MGFDEGFQLLSSSFKFQTLSTEDMVWSRARFFRNWRQRSGLDKWRHSVLPGAALRNTNASKLWIVFKVGNDSWVHKAFRYHDHFNHFDEHISKRSQEDVVNVLRQYEQERNLWLHRIEKCVQRNGEGAKLPARLIEGERIGIHPKLLQELHPQVKV